MYIGTITTWSEFYRVTSAMKKNTPEKTGLAAIADSLTKKQADKDTVTVGSSSVSIDDAGIYKPHANQMRVLECNITFADPSNPSPLDQMEITKIRPASEKSYIEQDALMNQYMKQYRIEYESGEDGSLQIRDESVKLVLPEMVSEEELESFRQELCAKGLGDDIDWWGVEQDFIQMRAGFYEMADADTMGQKVDYLASRYAVLKERIQTRYTDETERNEQMETLNRLYQSAKEELANTYANEIGGYYEALGEEGISEEFRANIMELVDNKTKAYEDHLAQNADYAKISNPEDTWLLQDDGFLAAQLRESYAAGHGTAEGIEDNVRMAAEDNYAQEAGASAYTIKDLVFIGQYARELKNQAENVGRIWGIDSKDKDADHKLGEALVREKQYIEELASSSGISSEAEDLVNRVFEPYIAQYLDALDKCIEDMRGYEYSWLHRTNYIDRDAVYSAYKNTLMDTQSK